MTYLVDANVLSEPTRSEPDAKVVGWLAKHERERERGRAYDLQRAAERG